MTIYNRWGEQVYLTNDINKGWDGTVEGKDASVGSYVYIIRYVASDGKEKQKKGTLTLIR
ncbi:MAG: gliding motility-associated-like protein [Vicingaceae bacterium]|jgi:gliding motility-associated-like protein